LELVFTTLKLIRPIGIRYFPFSKTIYRLEPNLILEIWQEIFVDTHLSDISVIFAHRLTDNLKNILVHQKSSKVVIKNIIAELE